MIRTSLLVLLISYTTILHASDPTNKDHNWAKDKPGIVTQINSIVVTMQSRDEEIQQLIAENASLKQDLAILSQRVENVETRLNASSPILTAYLYNDTVQEWTPCISNGEWQAISFTKFSGPPQFRDNSSLSQMIIPEDGLYRIFANYNWKGTVIKVMDKDKEVEVELLSAPYTGIGIDAPACVFKSEIHYLKGLHQERGSLESIKRLKQGEKVMLSIIERLRAQYHLPSFQLTIEKLL